RAPAVADYRWPKRRPGIASRSLREKGTIVSTMLIGVDGSTRSEDAVAFARRLAGAASGRVVVACAFPYADATGRGADLAYRAALAAAVPVARALGARLEVIGVVSPDLCEAPAVMGARSALTLREDVGRHIGAELESVVKGLRSEVWAEAVRLEGDPAHELAE